MNIFTKNTTKLNETMSKHFITFSCSRKVFKNRNAISPTNLQTIIKNKMVSLVRNVSKISLIRPLLGLSRGYSQEAVQQTEEDILYKKIDVEIKGHDVAVLRSYTKFICHAAKELDITVEQKASPPKVIDKLSLLKSVHVYKKHFVQYEMRTHYRAIELKRLTGSTADIFLEYIQRNVPEGVGMKTTRTQLLEMPEHITPTEDILELQPEKESSKEGTPV